jgi:hypothetical protein
MKKIIAASLMLLAAEAVSAASVGPAGCGLGYLIFNKDSQVLAATTNGTGGQIFGITSGTSGCEQGSGVAKLEAFIESNRVAFANDVARGQGETLVSVTSILRCQDAGQVGEVLKQNYSLVFPSAATSADDVGSRVRDVLKSNNVSCLSAG